MRRVIPCLLATLSVSTAASQLAGPAALPSLLTRIGDRVEQYYGRAQSIMCEETVRLDPLGFDLLSNGGHVRRLVYELRIAWEAPSGGGASPEATVLRQLISVDGRPPRPGDEPGCMDPKPVSTEPLAMLLGSRQREYAFTWAGTGRTSGRASVTLDYKSVSVRPADIAWKGECVTVDLPGRTRGRVWVD